MQGAIEEIQDVRDETVVVGKQRVDTGRIMDDAVRALGGFAVSATDINRLQFIVGWPGGIDER